MSTPSDGVPGAGPSDGHWNFFVSYTGFGIGRFADLGYGRRYADYY